MRDIILMADGARKVYSVPEAAAENLEKYCLDFCDKWLWTSPDAAVFRKSGVLRYDERDFISWLNKYIFPESPSIFVEELDDNEFPDKYRGCPEFDF